MDFTKCIPPSTWGTERLLSPGWRNNTSNGMMSSGPLPPVLLRLMNLSSSCSISMVGLFSGTICWAGGVIQLIVWCPAAHYHSYYYAWWIYQVHVIYIWLWLFTRTIFYPREGYFPWDCTVIRPMVWCPQAHYQIVLLRLMNLSSLCNISMAGTISRDYFVLLRLA